MSKLTTQAHKVTVLEIAKRKAAGAKISMITCYDSSFAKVIDATGVDMVLVGDSLGNVMMGYQNTLPVTLDDMIHHGASVARGLTRPMLCIDMPFMSYQVSPEQAVESAGRLVQEGFAEAVKLEGGASIVEHVKKIVQAGIPVIGHLGLTPQSIHSLGGYRVQGKGKDAEERMLEDARLLDAAGICALVLELVPAELARRVTAEISAPTIGIGAGAHCDGQVLVLQDMLGFDESFSPKFLKRYANVGQIVRDAVIAYDSEVKSGAFPRAEHSF